MTDASVTAKLLEYGFTLRYPPEFQLGSESMNKIFSSVDEAVRDIPGGATLMFGERIRAGGAGIPAFYTPAGVGTLVAGGKESREFDGKKYLMEEWLRADFALIKAWKGDRMGNLVYRKTARNFNPMMAAAARVTIAEIEQLVEPGEIDPDTVMTPGIYVQRIVVGDKHEKRIERRTVRTG
jgi:3-oxoacid CoA-transferase subunit A